MSDNGVDNPHVMAQIAEGLNDFLNQGARSGKIGFAVLVFPFDGPAGARIKYASNARREDMVAALKEVAAQLEGQPVQGGTA